MTSAAVDQFSANNWGDQLVYDEPNDKYVKQVKVSSHYKRAMGLSARKWAKITDGANKAIVKRKKVVKKHQVEDFEYESEPIMASSD